MQNTIANTQLTIAGITIKTDSEGRYCLNDLHKAAGGEQKHRPSIWFANMQTQQLIDELEAENPASNSIVMVRGRGITGTYAVRELVYAYAMWISPKFHLEVIRTFDELHTKGIVMTPAVALQKAGNRYPQDHQKGGTNAPDRRETLIADPCQSSLPDRLPYMLSRLPHRTRSRPCQSTATM